MSKIRRLTRRLVISILTCTQGKSTHKLIKTCFCSNQSNIYFFRLVAYQINPRNGKYGHAAIFHLVKCNATHGAVDCMLCNLPASTEDKPSLLRHQNVVTFFHEVSFSRDIISHHPFLSYCTHVFFTIICTVWTYHAWIVR